VNSDPIPRRHLPSGGPDFSVLGLVVVPPPLPGPSGDRRVIALLRRARAAGVTTFDVASSPQPRQAELLLGAAFPSEDRDLRVIVGRKWDELLRPETGTPRAEAAEDLSTRLRRSLEESARRFGPDRLAMVEWLDEEFPSHLDWDSAVHGIPGVTAPGLVRRVSGNPPRIPEVLGTPSVPPVLSGPLSLLDGRVIPLMDQASAGRRARFLARDPFAGGRLDGSRAAGTGVERGPGAGPIRLRELQAEFEPVLRLAYLTEGHVRTLAQAAVRFAAAWPWVVSVIAPLPPADRLEELLGTFATPALSPEEIRRALPAERLSR
jgi:aryl-alcohol dehydrogenase-like predicted oxidoreductase